MSPTSHDSLKSRELQIRRVLFITLFLNLFVAVIKMLVGHFSGLLSLSSSGLESLFDSTSNVLALVSIYFAHMPADEGHHYGHHKYETLGAVLIAVILFLSGIQMSIEVYERFYTKKVATDLGLLPFITIGVSMAVSAFVSWYEKKKAKELNSNILYADSEHTFGDLIMSIGVLVSIICYYNGLFWPDILVGALISFYMVYLAIKIVKQNLGELLDASPEYTNELKELAKSHPAALDVHRFRVRGNSYLLYIDFHLLMDESLSLRESHELGHEVEDLLKGHLLKHGINSDITVHVEPFEEDHQD